MTHTYNLHESKQYRAATRDFAPTFEVHHICFSPVGDSTTTTLATYSTRAAAELVISALRAAQADLK